MKNQSELRFKVDLDVEQGRTPNDNHPNIFPVFVRQTKQLNLQVIAEFLKGNHTVAKEAIECLSKSFRKPPRETNSALTSVRLHGPSPAGDTEPSPDVPQAILLLGG